MGPGDDVALPGSSVPPPVTAASVGAASTEARDEKKDSGARAVELFYLRGLVGGSYANLTTFSESSLGLEQTSAGGVVLGADAGVRLLFLTLGAQLRSNVLSSFTLWEVNGEVGFHVPIGHADPYFSVHGGYAFVGSLTDANFDAPNVDPSARPHDAAVHGWDAGLAVGADYYFNAYLSLGGELAATGYFLRRPPVGLPDAANQLSPAQQQAVRSSDLYQNSGDAAGFGATLGVHLGLHLGI